MLRAQTLPGGEEEVGEEEESGAVLDVKDGRLEECVELGVEVGVVSVTKGEVNSFRSPHISFNTLES